VIDDLLPQASWPEGHAAKIPPLLASLEANKQLCCTRLAWATGIMIVARRASDHSLPRTDAVAHASDGLS
jgi:hypothetical protein